MLGARTQGPQLQHLPKAILHLMHTHTHVQLLLPDTLPVPGTPLSALHCLGRDNRDSTAHLLLQVPHLCL